MRATQRQLTISCQLFLCKQTHVFRLTGLWRRWSSLTMWPELESSSQRRELSLSGSKLTTLLESTEDSVDPELYTLSNLNFLSLSNSPRLTRLSSDLNGLRSLGTLILSNNALKILPSELILPKLKVLDLSGNKLSSLPTNDYFVNLVNLVTLNLSFNALASFESQSLLECKSLSRLDLRSNELTDIDTLCSVCPSSLTELLVASNKLVNMPDNVSEKLPNLKLLDMSHNALESVPQKLGLCTRLKELNLRDNDKLKDTRLKKLIEQKATKTVLEYIRNHGTVDNCSQTSTKGKKSKTKLKKENSQRQHESETQILKPLYTINVMKMSTDTFVQVDTAKVKEVRPFLVCCLVRDVDLSAQRLKSFIQLQTKLHESTCQRRLIATIATHDWDKVKAPLVYTTLEPSELLITPLNSNKKLEATTLVNRLNNEAETLRKEKKRNCVSGLHKYLSLLDNLDAYPCIMDGVDRIISFPPITNCEETKIDANTKHVLVEVTSNKELKVAKIVTDTLLAGMAELRLGRNRVPLETSSSSSSSSDKSDGDSSDEDEKEHSVLQVEPLRLVNKDEGSLRLVYPSKVDLIFDSERKIRVNRQH